MKPESTGLEAIALLVGTVAGLITIIVYMTGHQSLPELFRQLQIKWNNIGLVEVSVFLVLGSILVIAIIIFTQY